MSASGIEENYLGNENNENAQFSRYFNSQSLLSLKFHNHGKDKLTVPSLTITFSHLYREISHSTFFFKFQGYSRS